MAKAKSPAPKPAAAKKPAVKKVVSALLPKKADKAYTASKLVAHLAAAVSAKGFGDVSKKQAAAFLEEYTGVLFSYAPVGAKIPGLGKLVLRQVKARPAREGTNPKTNEKIQIPSKPASKKLVFRFSKEAKDHYKK